MALIFQDQSLIATVGLGSGLSNGLLGLGSTIHYLVFANVRMFAQQWSVCRTTNHVIVCLGSAQFNVRCDAFCIISVTTISSVQLVAGTNCLSFYTHILLTLLVILLSVSYSASFHDLSVIVWQLATLCDVFI